MLYSNVDANSLDDLYFLRLFNDYDQCQISEFDKIDFFYEDPDSLNMSLLRKKYNLTTIMGSYDQLTQISNLKKWASEILYFKGRAISTHEYDFVDCLDLIDMAKSSGYGLNCRYIALFFTQIMLSVGFKARLVSCVPMDTRYNSCHFVTEVFIESLHKWVVVDVSYNLLYYNKNGELLNLFEMRKIITKEEKIRFWAKDSDYFNDVKCNWLKNVFRFKFIKNNKYNMLACEKRIFVCLNPKNFILTNKTIQNKKNNSITQLEFYYNDKLFW